MKLLFNFFSNNNVEYKYKVDFNYDGEFHGVCKAVWVKAKVVDSKFGTNQHKSHVDMLADEKLATAYKNEVLKPYAEYESKDDYHHLRF